MIPRLGFRMHLHKGLTLAAVLLMFSSESALREPLIL